MERNKEVGLDRQQEETERGRNRHFPHAHTIEFVQSDVEPAWESGDSPDSGHRIQRVRSNASRDVGQTSFGRQWRESIHHAPTVSEPSHWADDDQRRFRRTATVQTGTSIHQAKLTTKETGFGGFPYPHVIIGRLFLRLFPRLERHFTTTLTVPHTVTICSQRVGPVSAIYFRLFCYQTLSHPRRLFRAQGVFRIYHLMLLLGRIRHFVD